MQIIWIVTLTFLAFYILKIIRYYLGWSRIDEFETGSIQDYVPASIIIPVRNEQQNINGLLSDLIQQDYPAQSYEVILVNDHSTDLTLNKIKPFCEKYSNIKVIDLQDHSIGKKAALDTGIKNSSGEVVITTDADCRVGKKWISSIISYYNNCSGPEMIIGLVDMTSGKSVFDKFQQFEFASLVACGAGATGISHPIFCNGANLAYKKELYSGYSNPLNQKTASGDDTLFMLSVKRDTRNTIKLLKSKEAIVYTKPQPDLRSFIHQRIRWTSKSKYYRDPDIIFLSLIVLMLNVSVAGALIILLMLKSYLLFPVLFISKTMADFIFVRKTFDFFNKKNLVKYLILFQLFYPFYILIIGILGNILRYSWKERRFS